MTATNDRGVDMYAKENQVTFDDIYPDKESATLESLAAQVAELQRTHDQILIIAKEVQDKVQPVLDSLKSSPIFKMMGVGQ